MSPKVKFKDGVNKMLKDKLLECCTSFWTKKN